MSSAIAPPGALPSEDPPCMITYSRSNLTVDISLKLGKNRLEREIEAGAGQPS